MRRSADDEPWSESEWSPDDEYDGYADEGEIEDWGEDVDEETVELSPCPRCGRQIYEEAERCPSCGAYVIRSTSVWQGRPLWWLLLGALGILATMLTLLAF